jgi:hypothetical protein
MLTHIENKLVKLKIANKVVYCRSYFEEFERFKKDLDN